MTGCSPKNKSSIPKNNCKSVCINVGRHFPFLGWLKKMKGNYFEIDMHVRSFFSFSSRATCAEKIGVFIRASFRDMGCKVARFALEISCYKSLYLIVQYPLGHSHQVTHSSVFSYAVNKCLGIYGCPVAELLKNRFLKC